MVETFANRQQGGVTLIEMMISVVIIAILAAIAVPAYQDYVERSRVRTAGADLVSLAAALENRFQRQLSYPVGTTATTAATQGLVTGWNPAQGDNFTYSAVVIANGYTLTAAGGGCTLTLNQANNRTIAGGCGGLSSW